MIYTIRGAIGGGLFWTSTQSKGLGRPLATFDLILVRTRAQPGLGRPGISFGWRPGQGIQSRLEAQLDIFVTLWSPHILGL